jgi:hypothetical protein
MKKTPPTGAPEMERVQGRQGENFTKEMQWGSISGKESEGADGMRLALSHGI